ncbi:MAG: hypothetical protein V1487_00450 [bacterium]
MIIKTKLASKFIVPHVEEIARELTSSSQIGIMVKRARQLSLTQFCRFSLNNVPYAGKALKKDFATGIKIMCELEIIKLLDQEQGCFGLHNQMVDMAIALNNERLIRYFCELSSRYKFQPGLLTYNPTALINLLSTMQDVPRELIIFTPLNSPWLPMDYIACSHLQFANWDG